MRIFGKDILKLIFLLSLGAFFIWLSIKDLSHEQQLEVINNIKEVFRGNRWPFLLLSVLIGFLSVLFRGLRSVLMLEPLGYPVSIINSYHATMIGYMANLAFPRWGEVIRCTVLQTHEKVPFQKTIGTVITERVIDVFLAGLVFLFAFLLEYGKLVNIFSDTDLSGKLTKMFSGNGRYFSIGIILLIAIGIITIYATHRKIRNLPVYRKLMKIVKEFQAGLTSVVKIKKPVLFVIYSISIWICYFLIFYLRAFTFPDLTALGVQQMARASLSCFVVGSLGFLIAQGGLGAYPLLVSVVLLLYGIPEESGLAIGWVLWATESFMYLFLGFLSFVCLLPERRKG